MKKAKWWTLCAPPDSLVKIKALVPSAGWWLIAKSFPPQPPKTALCPRELPPQGQPYPMTGLCVRVQKLSPVALCRTIVKGRPSFRAPCVISWGLCYGCISFGPVLPPSLSHRCCSQEPFLLSLLHGNLFSVCFPGNSTCSSWHYKDWEG